MSDNPNFRVIIIGSGLAGSCLANGLLKHGIDFHVYERLRPDSKREGYQIRLGAHALKGMRECLSQEHLEEIVKKFGRASNAKSEAPVLKNERFETMLDLTQFPSYNKSAPINRVVLRDALSQPVQAAGKITYSMELDRYEILAPGTTEERVRVWFNDGTKDLCDILVAADGSHSKVNTQIGLNNITQIDDYTCMLAKSDLPTTRLLETNPCITRNPILTFARGRSLYYCAYLPRLAQEKAEHDEKNSSSMFGINVPSSECPVNLKELSPKAKWDFVAQALREWSPEYHEIIDLVRDSDLYVYKGRVSSNPGLRWRAKVRANQTPELGHHRVWLIGDAMHAMLPNRGMGGNTALCDTSTALPLLKELADLASPLGRVDSHIIEQACRTYEMEMMPRAFTWVKKSGGRTVVPLDASTVKGKVLLALAALAMRLTYHIYRIVRFFTNKTIVDEAPELR